MGHSTTAISNDLVSQLEACNQDKFSGKLVISGEKHTWNLYFRLGGLMWATGGAHPVRRWYRQMFVICPQINVKEIQFQPQDLELEYWDYHLLIKLYKQGEIEPKQVDKFSENVVAKVLFEIKQYTHFAPITFLKNPDIVLDVPINFISTSTFISRMEKEWDSWKTAGLGNISPNLAPVIKKPEELRQQLNPVIYKNIVQLVNGQNTLRDLSVKMKQGVQQIAASLLPYIIDGYIELFRVQDLRLPNIKINNADTLKSTQPKQTSGLLVACIDDSPQVCQMLEQIITKNGMRFMKITNATDALPNLVQFKPDLIFLDLIMPVVNGYELCTQVRRVSHFKETPVVILTGSDGLIDRVHAKVVGATDFLSKPVVTDKILAMVRKYLKTVKAP